MSGILYHGRELVKGEPYTASDGKSHYETKIVDGDYFSIVNSSWDEFVAIASKLGIEPLEWPVYDDGIDLPLEEIRTMNESLAMKIGEIRDADIDQAYYDRDTYSLPKLRKIFDWIRSGQVVVYCRM